MKDPYRTVLRPVLTEKTTGNIEHLNQYAFAVDAHANKIEIKRAIETIFDVRVTKVSTRWRRGKERRIGRAIGRTSSWKEAIVHVAPGDKIDVY